MSKTLAKIDNGGAEAIKGFNFQKANLILVAIENYTKSGFKIYIEAEDDIVVSYDDYNAFIQVKKQKHTFNSLLKKENGKKKGSKKNSILEKNLYSGGDGDRYKIFLSEFGEKDFKNLIAKEPGEICNKLYELSEEAKTEVSKKLPVELVSKLDNFYLYISSISEDFNDAERHLIGTLNKSGISVDNNRGRNVISELCLMIDQKGEKKIENFEDRELKYLNSEYLSQVFITSEVMSNFDKILDGLNYNGIKKGRIRQQKNKIDIALSESKNGIVLFLNEFPNIEELSDKEIIDIVIEKFKEKHAENELIALTIEIICEMGAK